MAANFLTRKAERVLELGKQFQSDYASGAAEEAYLMAGILLEGTGLAWRALSAGGMTLERLRTWLPKLDEESREVGSAHVDYVELALEEAHKLGNNWIGTEHLLLALLSSQSGRYVVERIELDPESLRATILRLLGLPFVGMPYPLSRGERES